MHRAGVPEKRNHYVLHGSYFTDGLQCCAQEGLPRHDSNHDIEEKGEEKDTAEEEMYLPLREKFFRIHSLNPTSLQQAMTNNYRQAEYAT